MFLGNLIETNGDSLTPKPTRLEKFGVLQHFRTKDGCLKFRREVRLKCPFPNCPYIGKKDAHLKLHIANGHKGSSPAIHLSDLHETLQTPEESGEPPEVRVQQESHVPVSRMFLAIPLSVPPQHPHQAETPSENTQRSDRFSCVNCPKHYKNRRHLLNHMKRECGKEPQIVKVILSVLAATKPIS
ncbi:hypothetical protein GWI33_012756 [Rhynchophorus ferrugineus]|uniref:C2H2-type domain-containing protein n=1 Tax=Rhynchophorus ferrugineus TaxID=354439 RepID=A0A834IRI5_RHYFE|nr:hypothetical protein GWI33_012756 [Rhynchophorus ferrugineus]